MLWLKRSFSLRALSSPLNTLPRRVIVQEVLEARYEPGERPSSWDARGPGVETVRTRDGELVKLLSNGGQSSPASGWELLLTKESANGAEPAAYEWTLYGILSER